MRLHCFYRSSTSYRVRIALNLKGVAYEQTSYRLRRGDSRQPNYLALNPQGLVPALEDGGTVLTQSLAIIEYLDETIPTPPLLPANPVDRAYVRGLAQIVASDIHPIDNLRVLTYLRDPLGHDQATVNAWYNHWIAVGFEAFETILSRDPRRGLFCYGDQPGLGDICLMPQIFNAQNFALDMRPYPTISAIARRCDGLPPFASAHPTRQPDAE